MRASTRPGNTTSRTCKKAGKGKIARIDLAVVRLDSFPNTLPFITTSDTIAVEAAAVAKNLAINDGTAQVIILMEATETP